MLKQLISIIFFSFATAANATPVYTYSTDDLGAAIDLTGVGSVNTSAGAVTYLDTSFDTDNQSFSWDYTIASVDTGTGTVVNDGFWLVVSNGENPKGHADEYAILYGDLNAGTVSAYVFDGENKRDSYENQGTFLDNFDNALTVSTNADGSTDVGFTIDTSVINSYSNDSLWDGIAFGNELGLWFHPTANSSFTYDTASPNITGYGSQFAGWYDTSAALSTVASSATVVTAIPEPTSIALLSIGALVCFGFRRREKPS